MTEDNPNSGDKPTPPDKGGTPPQKPTPPPVPRPANKPPAAPGSAQPPKPVPPRPAAPAGGQTAVKRPVPGGKPPASQARRHFIFTWLGFAWTAFALATAAALSTTVRFLFPNVLFEPKMAFKIGKPDEYELGVVDLRWKERYGVWVVRNSEGMYALSTICTHLGCTPSWLESAQKFKCPCHGSGFFKTGINFEGPAPRPLERYAISLADDGQVFVDKSRIFQQEKGEWENPASFLYL